MYGRTYLYYSPTIIRTRKNKTKTRTAASRIAEMLYEGKHPVRTSNTSVSITFFTSLHSRRNFLQNFCFGFKETSISKNCYKLVTFSGLKRQVFAIILLIWLQHEVIYGEFSFLYRGVNCTCILHLSRNRGFRPLRKMEAFIEQIIFQLHELSFPMRQ